MKNSTIFLVLTWLTALVLAAATIPIVQAHQGFDIARFVREINANSSTQFMGVDLSMMGLVFVIWMYLDAKRHSVKRWWLPLIGIFLVGLAIVVPWYLYLREKHLEKATVIS